ncbi:uncharacterized protein METZ01_LOCUS394508 [marine metagenome]|uniref:Uncharacterized protein n=1 Tax=marine metagenome TaxID=408172 RepID=A0A382V594_9ZZZZ
MIFGTKSLNAKENEIKIIPAKINNKKFITLIAIPI